VIDLVYEICCTGHRGKHEAVQTWFETHVAPAWMRLPGLSALDLYEMAESGAHDPFVNDGPGPLLQAMLQFPGIDALLRAIADRRFTRAECGLPERGFVFCCFNASYKITPAIFAVWMRLLATVPDSVLWLVGSHPLASANLRGEAARSGIAPERLVFAPKVPYPDHLARHALADLFLDTVPYNAGVTASDALWAGLPLVTLRGRSFAGRMGASLLTAAGLPELIAESEADYAALALHLARTPDRLAHLAARLCDSRATSALFDAAASARHLEAAFDLMWRRHCTGQPPTGFALEKPWTPA